MARRAADAGQAARLPMRVRPGLVGPIELDSGMRLRLGRDTGLWRVATGLLTARHEVPIACACADALLRAGDLIGLECLAGSEAGVEVCAMVPSTLGRDDPSDAIDAFGRLAEGYLQSRRQGALLAAVRTGPVSGRVLRLLWLVGEAGGADEQGDEACELPSLRQLAAVVDSTPESVSRVLSDLRRRQVIGDRDATRVRIRTLSLRAMVTWSEGLLRHA
jgi:CRP-like cAMP-binding protein